MVRQLTIDRAGRLVIPRDIRARLRLRGGSRLRLVEEDDRIVLSPEHAEAPLREKGGLLVYTGALPRFVDHRALREERLDRLSRS